MRPAEFSTDNPPVQIDNVELAEYVRALRRRIEVQNDLMEELAKEVLDRKAENARELGLDYEPVWLPTNKDIEDAMRQRRLHQLTSPQPSKPWVGLTDEEERKTFEQWYVCNAFDYERNPIGSRECGLQWSAWKARAAHGITGEQK
jgi:hypothetical protein